MLARWWVQRWILLELTELYTLNLYSFLHVNHISINYTSNKRRVWDVIFFILKHHLPKSKSKHTSWWNLSSIFYRVDNRHSCISASIPCFCYFKKQLHWSIWISVTWTYWVCAIWCSDICIHPWNYHHNQIMSKSIVLQRVPHSLQFFLLPSLPAIASHFQAVTEPLAVAIGCCSFLNNVILMK